MVWPRQKDARGQNIKINYGMHTTGEKEKRKSKKNVDGRSTSSHGNNKLRCKSYGIYYSHEEAAYFREVDVNGYIILKSQPAKVQKYSFTLSAGLKPRKQYSEF